MKLYRLERTQVLPILQAEAWQFFSQPLNLPQITPDWLSFELTGRAPEKMVAGQVLCFRLKPFGGIRRTWITEITHSSEPEYFVDEQRFGPYRFWQHQHVFVPHESGTKMSDIVHYALGPGILGRWVQPLVVAPRLERIFNYRAEKLEAIFHARAGGNL